MPKRKLPPIDTYPGDPGIDPGIRELVEFLRAHGFDTDTSCEGQRAHERRGAPSPYSSVLPYVTIAPNPGDTLEATRLRLARSLLAAGYRDFSTHIDECHGYSNRPESGEYLAVARVEFLVDSPVRPYAKLKRRRQGKTGR